MPFTGTTPDLTTTVLLTTVGDTVSTSDVGETVDTMPPDSTYAGGGGDETLIAEGEGAGEDTGGEDTAEAGDATTEK